MDSVEDYDITFYHQLFLYLSSKAIKSEKGDILADLASSDTSQNKSSIISHFALDAKQSDREET